MERQVRLVDPGIRNNDSIQVCSSCFDIIMIVMLRTNHTTHSPINRVVELSNIKPSNVNDSGAKIGTSDGRPPSYWVGELAAQTDTHLNTVHHNMPYPIR